MVSVSVLSIFSLYHEYQKIPFPITIFSAAVLCLCLYWVARVAFESLQGWTLDQEVGSSCVLEQDT